jgi:hypothetical protein
MILIFTGERRFKTYKLQFDFKIVILLLLGTISCIFDLAQFVIVYISEHSSV